MSLLTVDHLTVAYEDAGSTLLAVKDVSFDLEPGEFIGVVGESGSGKSTLGYAISRLLRPPGQVIDGRVSFAGRDLLTLSEPELRKIRWAEMSIVMQSGMSALNPVLPIKRQFADTFISHTRMSSREMSSRMQALLELVQMDPQVANRYPHELSGGMKQRVSIALALALNPKLVIMDEPTTALDVVVQRSIVQNLKALRRQYEVAVVFISHDLGTVLELADKVAVMYAGEFVEVQPAAKLLRQPSHPYTKALLKCFPDPRADVVHMIGIPGSPPDMKSPPAGCCFAPRCIEAFERCTTEAPLLTLDGDIHVACHAVVTGTRKGAAK